MTTDMNSFDQSPLDAFMQTRLDARNPDVVCVCVKVVLAEFVTNATNERRCWDLRPYQPPFRAGSCSGFWRLIEIGCCFPGSYPWYGAGCVNEFGELVNLPEEFCSTYSYDGYMELQIGCLTINNQIWWPESSHREQVGDHCYTGGGTLPCRILTPIFDCATAISNPFSGDSPIAGTILADKP